MAQGQVFLKVGGGWHCPIWLFEGLSFLNLEITLPFPKLSHAVEEMLFFSATIILWKRLSKNEPEKIP